MSNTFVKLSTGDIEIEQIREVYEDLKGTDLKLMNWKPRSALIERNRGTVWLYTGQKFDPKYIDLIEDGWTHDHCQVCSVSFVLQLCRAIFLCIILKKKSTINIKQSNQPT